MSSPAVALLSTIKLLKPKNLGVIHNSVSFILHIYSLGNCSPSSFQNMFLIHLLFSFPTATMLGQATVTSHPSSYANLLIGRIPLSPPCNDLHSSQWCFNSIGSDLTPCAAPSSHCSYNSISPYLIRLYMISCCLPANSRAILPLISFAPASPFFFFSVHWNPRAHSYLRTLGFLAPKSSEGWLLQIKLVFLQKLLFQRGFSLP